jgi:hypothetical protein
MINVSFGLSNPWSKRWNNVWCRVYQTPFKNKFIELEVIKDAFIVSFTFRLNTRTDHAGLYMDLGLLGYSISFNFYDSRHWDYNKGTWETYNDH